MLFVDTERNETLTELRDQETQIEAFTEVLLKDCYLIYMIF